jgi:hypothetical protein
MKGYYVALSAVAIFLVCAYATREYVEDLKDLHLVLYYWSCFTILTGVWEMFFVLYYSSIVTYAHLLMANNISVWSTDYPWYYISPNLMPQIFYAEYGARADREYLARTNHDFWARLIESSHGLCCGSFSLCTILLAACGDYDKAFNCAMVAMGCQFMNSVLYMGQYSIQCNDPESVNFNSVSFPLGKWMSKRIFMWVNIFWFMFPSIIILQQLLGNPTDYIASKN